VPEFLREGKALDDFMNPDKIVIGHLDEKSRIFVEKIFEYFREKVTIIATNPETAEMIKYVNNAFLSTLISFSNEVANIAEKVKGIDSFEVMKALVADKRITTVVDKQKIVPGLASYLLPGCGFGGSCFPKDVKAISKLASSLGSDTPLLDAVLKINDSRPDKVVSMAENILGSLGGKKISILGLAFKPDTDDMRSSPSIQVIRQFEAKNSSVYGYDPKVTGEILEKNGIRNVTLCNSLEDCLTESHLAVLLTKWPEFEKINGKMLKQFMKKPCLIDGRGFLNKNHFENGSYHKIGYVK